MVANLLKCLIISGPIKSSPGLSNFSDRLMKYIQISDTKLINDSFNLQISICLKTQPENFSNTILSTSNIYLPVKRSFTVIFM